MENCETSAWGRALANLGIGIDTSIASSNEVAIAIAKQESGSTAAPKKVSAKPTLKTLTDDIIAKMKAAVESGKRDAVESALGNYKVTAAQRKDILG